LDVAASRWNGNPKRGRARPRRSAAYHPPVPGSYWLAEKADPIPRVALGGSAEVEIVGAGITGCSCALALAGRGVRVRVHEAREVAGGASGRNGGFALRGGAMPYDRAREWLGAERAAAYWRLTERYLDEMVSLGGGALRRTGSLRLAADDEERDELRGEYEALREDGFAAEWRDELPAPLAGRFPAGILHPPDASVQPARFVRRLAAAAAVAGAEIREHSRVGSLDELEAARVVVATDGYPSGLLGELEGLIVPTRGQMIATEPLAERLFDLPHYGRHGFDYWQQVPDGRILAGGFRDFALESEFTSDERTTEPIQQALERFVDGLVGRPVAVERRWAGIFGLVLDFLPVVGPVPGREGLWVAGGYSGHGNVLGFACGDLVAGALLGDPDPLLELFEPARLLGVEGPA
jgi:gamma-glutamylputrescine oxidase